jgi:RimJ/RimL family protein N-acetyltransferase
VAVPIVTLRDVIPPSLPIVTERLVLRPFTRGDLSDFIAIYASPDVSRFLYTEPYDDETGPAALEKRIGIPAFDRDDQALNLAMVVRESGDLVGSLAFFYRSHTHLQGEIGYVVRPDAQGRGFAREGATELLRLGFVHLGLHRITGQCDARNVASASVMRRLGMRREAHLRENEFVKGEWTDELMFAILASEWLPE